MYRISVVVPVFKGERVISLLVEEISRYFAPSKSQSGLDFIVSEVILVHDCGPDDSDEVMKDISRRHNNVMVVWLTKNFGQHAATLAGMSSTSGEWVATLDEDGQHDPSALGDLLDVAVKQNLQVVYASPTAPPPHGPLRNLASRLSKIISSQIIGNSFVNHFHSFRLIRGDVARSLSAYCGHNIYLDVGLLWVAGRFGICPVTLRREIREQSGYTYASLFGHFWRMILTSGTRPLRLISYLGIFSSVLAFILSVYFLFQKFWVGISVEGWASLAILVTFFSGLVLFAIGILAEYLAVVVGSSMGKPHYIIANRSDRDSIES